jgi:hypothetical protein
MTPIVLAAEVLWTVPADYASGMSAANHALIDVEAGVRTGRY